MHKNNNIVNLGFLELDIREQSRNSKSCRAGRIK
jgi:hypothetical protein